MLLLLFTSSFHNLPHIFLIHGYHSFIMPAVNSKAFNRPTSNQEGCRQLDSNISHPRQIRNIDNLINTLMNVLQDFKEDSTSIDYYNYNYQPQRLHTAPRTIDNVAPPAPCKLPFH